MNRTVVSLLSLLLLFLARAASAQTVAVLPPSGVNVAEGTLEAAQDLLRGHLVASGRFPTVLIVPGAIGKAERGAVQAVAEGRAAGSDLALVLHIARLSSTAQVRLTAYATTNGAVVFADRMAAASPDDLDRVLARLASGLATGRPAGETAELDTVTETEATPPMKRAASHVFGVGIGVAVPSDGRAMPGLSLYWMYDARTFLAEVSAGFHSADGQGDLSIGIGAYCPFGNGDLAPYLGGGARWATRHSDSGSGSGVQVYGALGGILGRLGSVQFRGQLEYFVDLYQTHATDWTYAAADTTYTSTTHESVGHGLGFTLGLGF